MVYLIAVVMGYFVATNGMVERRSKAFIGQGHTNGTYAKMSALGGLGGLFCIVPAAFFVGSSHGNGLIQGMLFGLASLGGAVLSGLIKKPALSYLVSAFTLPVNIVLTVIVYFISRS